MQAENTMIQGPTMSRMPWAYPSRGKTGDVKGLNRGGQTKITQRSGSRTYDYKYQEELRFQNTRAQ